MVYDLFTGSEPERRLEILKNLSGSAGILLLLLSSDVSFQDFIETTGF